MGLAQKTFLLLLAFPLMAAALRSSEKQEVIGAKHSKVYHTHPHKCGSAKRINEENIIRFGSIKEAEQAGRRLCKHCAALDRKAEEAKAKKHKEIDRSTADKKTGGARPNRLASSRPTEVAASSPLPEFARVTAVLVGGTVVLDNGEKAVLLGVACPAEGQPMGKDAADFLREKTEDHTVRITADTSPCVVQQRDELGRLRIYLTLEPDGGDLGAALISRGLAWLDRTAPFSRRVEYLQREETAWRKGRGVWERLAGPAGRREVVTGRHARTYHSPDCPHVQHLTTVMKMTLNEARSRRLVPCSRYRSTSNGQ